MIGEKNRIYVETKVIIVCDSFSRKPIPIGLLSFIVITNQLQSLLVYRLVATPTCENILPFINFNEIKVLCALLPFKHTFFVYHCDILATTVNILVIVCYCSENYHVGTHIVGVKRA